MATLQAKLTTQLPPPWVAPTTPLELPAGIKAAGLNKVLSQLLNNDETREFKFIINGEFLQEAESVASFLQDRDMSTEQILEVEYVEQLPSPEEGTPREHDDWVSTAGSWDGGAVLTGSYDGIARIWQDSTLVTALSGHIKAVKAAVCYSTARGRAAATASKDHTVRLWQLNDELQVEALALGIGHTASVDAIGVSADGVVCSGSWDHTIKLWDGDATAAPLKPAPKKKRKAAGEAATEISCTATLEEHGDAVTALGWLDRGTFVSGSHDHTLRAWDASAETCVRVVNFNKAVIAVSWSEAAQLLATAQGDKTVALWDVKAEAHLKTRLGHADAHQQMIVDVAWVPGSACLLASASHDHTSLLWDIRSPKLPLHTLTTHEDKALCVHWVSKELVITGGADCQLREARMGL